MRVAVVDPYPEIETRMRPNIKLMLLVPLVVVLCGAAHRVGAEVSPTGRNDIRAVKASATPVCENKDVNNQVKAALQLVCAQRRSEASPAAAEGLIVIGFLGG